jgi:hypothetical protein
MYMEIYYATYLGLCAAIIGWLGWTLHRAGTVFLNDAFGGNAVLAQAVARLLDVGFYLVSLGYVGLSYQSEWQQINSTGMVVTIAVRKLGGFLLLLGFAHVFNLLLLAIFRRRGSSNGTAAQGPAGV